MTDDINNTSSQEIQDIKARLASYFPDTIHYNEELILEQINTGEILSTPNKILPYLQTAFFEEHLLELQPDLSTRLFFTNLLDAPPDTEEEEDEDNIGDDDGLEYEVGSYLKKSDYVVIAPLNPAIGNARIRACKRVVIRFFMGTKAVELGCTFRSNVMLANNTPAMSIDFPTIGRVNRSYRPFRVKAVSGVDANVTILRPILNDALEKTHQINDVSAMGLSFQMLTDERNFEIGDQISLNVAVPGTKDLEIEGTIRGLHKARDKKRAMIICGIQFDLQTRSLATDIERVAAAIQRLQLREIAEKTADTRGVQLIK